MKTVYLYFALMLFLYSPAVLAQKENNVWAFGDRKGMDFNPGAPVMIATATAAREGGASVCDAVGKLLFYSDGDTVWDNTHSAMPNGFGLMGLMAAQGVSILPVPDEPGRYFIFTLESLDSVAGGPPVRKNSRLHYSLVDMALNGGKGDIYRKNVLLGDSMSEKMTLAPACDGFWLLTHHGSKPLFYAYKIRSSGVIDPPVMSATAGITATLYYQFGEIKLSPDNRWLGMCSTSSPFEPPEDRTELFEFDTLSGKVSGYYLLDSARGSYGLAFSPDGSKLYRTAIYLLGPTVAQYDLSLMPDATAVRTSAYIFRPRYAGIRLGPDGKIYLRRADKAYMGRINEPDKAGAASLMETDIISLPNFPDVNNRFTFGAPTLPYKRTRIYSRQDTLLCAGQEAIFRGDSTHSDFVWHDGDTVRDRSFSAAGTYWRHSRKNCMIYTDTISIELTPSDTIAGSSVTKIACFEQRLEVQAPASAGAYVWSDGGRQPNTILYPGELKWVYILPSAKSCRLVADTFKAEFIDFDPAVPDTFLCRDQQVLLDATTPDATDYLWNEGSSGSRLLVRTRGSYWVQVSVKGCRKTDTVLVADGSFSLSIGSDTVLCSGSTLLLRPNTNGPAAFVWQDGSRDTVLQVSSSGRYAVRAQQHGCTEQDSIQVTFKGCTGCVDIPNAFTPNGDGRNDLFRPLLSCPAKAARLLILNRYGQEVFASSEPTSSWDGSFKSQALEAGVYYYLYRVTFDFPDAKEELYKGDVTLLR